MKLYFHVSCSGSQHLINLQCTDLILHLQWLMLQYLVSWCSQLCFTLWDVTHIAMQVAYPSCVKNVWPYVW